MFIHFTCRVRSEVGLIQTYLKTFAATETLQLHKALIQRAFFVLEVVDASPVRPVRARRRSSSIISGTDHDARTLLLTPKKIELLGLGDLSISSILHSLQSEVCLEISFYHR